MRRLFIRLYILILPQLIIAQEWVARYNGPWDGIDIAQAVAIDCECNIYVTGMSMGAGSFFDYATLKYNSDGVQQWVARYNGMGLQWNEANAIAVYAVGAVYVTGVSDGGDTDYDYATVKYDSAGVEQWVARYNGTGNRQDRARAIVIDETGAVYVTGWSERSMGNTDYVTIKYDSLGVEQWVARYNGPWDGGDDARAIALDINNNVYVTGPSDGNDLDYATIKYLPTGIEEYHTNQIITSDTESTIFKGPLQLPMGVQYKVMDITGRVVESDKITQGIYFIEIDGQIAGKVIKVR